MAQVTYLSCTQKDRERHPAKTQFCEMHALCESAVTVSVSFYSTMRHAPFTEAVTSSGLGARSVKVKVIS